jgi:hypothetical protein
VFIGVYNTLHFSNIKKRDEYFLERKKGEVFFQPNIYQNPATVPSKFLPAPSAFLPNIISNALELLIFLVKLLLISSICWVPFSTFTILKSDTRKGSSTDGRDWLGPSLIESSPYRKSQETFGAIVVIENLPST